MNPSQSALPAELIGHVKNGVIVLDVPIKLPEGQTVRVEPINNVQHDTDRASRIRQLERLFAEWTKEDGKLSDEDADRLNTALEQNAGLSFRTPTVD